MDPSKNVGPDSRFPGQQPGLHQRPCRIQDRDVVWLRAVLEAYDGLGYLFGDGSGTVMITTTADRAAELDSLLVDLQDEATLQLG